MCGTTHGRTTKLEPRHNVAQSGMASIKSIEGNSKSWTLQKLNECSKAGRRDVRTVGGDSSGVRCVCGCWTTKCAEKQQQGACVDVAECTAKGAKAIQVQQKRSERSENNWMGRQGSRQPMCSHHSGPWEQHVGGERVQWQGSVCRGAKLSMGTRASERQKCASRGRQENHGRGAGQKKNRGHGRMGTVNEGPPNTTTTHSCQQQSTFTTDN